MNSDQETDDVLNTYEKIAADYATTVKSDVLDHRYIEKFLLLFKPGQKILDIGVGTGTLSAEMKENHGLDVTAIDFSKEMLDIARKNHADLKILRMDLRDLNFKDESFDGIFANYSLIHIVEGDVADSIKGMNRVLKPGGLLYLALQEPITPMDKDGYYPLAYRPELKMFINLFTEDEIKNHLVKTDFKIVSIERREPQKETEFPFYKLFIIAEKI